ncbi:hypothetical protein COU78_00495 [Candidatus Peregrinibacteria bacterium CG10_big_fil_rev_8_21_14_0_10_49_24]|nr:MAG: hypothetical protein COV83_06540 [Candidatus Peregrinibacteria bacterium CG11_big_fil_rev_8_21_14_0_20_49_14]PIR51665.1 MAG: hypothetical protein COU78_00495 [Candidatus Peregrinibacteria bacterium CG10_big_fil_rev_8_21_14_0_10_49_24]PJA67975.1 MAG: hypothetical protein CO157_01465 [Candidatus Peregrinibacteria bacterium CG_4_9_14_3_um_filter_49_12]
MSWEIGLEPLQCTDMRRWQKILLGIVILATLGIGVWEYRWDFTMIEQTIRSHPFMGAVLYIILLMTSVVFLPFSSLPLLPLAARVFGVWMTAVLSILGWWIGCLIAFQIARLGRPYLEKVTSLEIVDRLEQKIPKDIGFAGIVILRMILPVDVTSFALGLLKHLSFSTYAIASLIGIIPFAFVWSYAGGEIGRGAFLSSALVFIGMTVAVLVIRRLWQRHR